ncbi:MAG TPA: OB-fold nucleic acid binding domain-containing protein, partial [Thermodesulfobacteriota bacterium]
MSLAKERLETLRRLREAGIDPYPNDFKPTHTSAELRAQFPEGEPAGGAETETTYAVAGRVVARRSFGKATFVTLQDRAGRIQAHLRKDVLGDEGYGLLDFLDLGDFLGVVGPVFRTRTGELTVKAEQARLVAKALRPLPEKWHGLQDVEIRYRQRYLDLIVNPDSRRVFETRSRVLAALRAFLNARGYLEVETPM